MAVKQGCGPNSGYVTERGTNFVKQSFFIPWLVSRHRASVRCCSHGAVSTCWRHRRKGASTQRGGYSSYPMRSWLVIAGLFFAVVITVLPLNAQVNVKQHHNHDSRDGLYVDPAFTQSNATSLTRDLSFDGTVSGSVYAQPLYIEGGPTGAMVIVATESNNVYALDAADGTVIWQRNNLGASVPLNQLHAATSIQWGSLAPLLSISRHARFFWMR